MGDIEELNDRYRDFCTSVALKIVWATFIAFCVIIILGEII